MPARAALLVLNAGSSSLKFAAYTLDSAIPQERIAGQVEGIGARARFSAHDATGTKLATETLPEPTTHAAAVAAVIGLLERSLESARVIAVGHRVVHGGPHHAAPAQIDTELLADLQSLIPLAPLHQPHNLAGIDAAMAHFPDVPHIACFDTAFHRTQPWEAETFALPPQFYEQGIRRYGFHGLSYEFIARTLAAQHPDLAAGRVIAAHLGNGASLCAMQAGRSIATTMGFTALDGVPMGTRTGSIDPGVILHLLGTMGMSLAEVTRLLYSGSGLNGMSGISQDVREIEAAGTEQASRALSHFAWRVRREIGALAACLGGLDALVFTAGIGEHSAPLRAAICENLGFLCITLDPARNASNAPTISADGTTPVLVIHTDEERMMALHTLEVLAA
ncbi:MAG: acetate/propionate family kinase [Alphaproteobacteria bacterium]|nr:acetate/propionate family kinase [Alphaproteobacteria bacterium]